MLQGRTGTFCGREPCPEKQTKECQECAVLETYGHSVMLWHRNAAKIEVDTGDVLGAYAVDLYKADIIVCQQGWVCQFNKRRVISFTTFRSWRLHTTQNGRHRRAILRSLLVCGEFISRPNPTDSIYSSGHSGRFGHEFLGIPIQSASAHAFLTQDQSSTSELSAMDEVQRLDMPTIQTTEMIRWFVKRVWTEIICDRSQSNWQQCV